jgi:large subunit ribosomal protein L15
MNLSNLKRPDGAHKSRKRIGRGLGSGHGKTSTRGQKGQRSRSGRGKGAAFEGGQMPLSRRVPKRGFTNIFKKEYQIVNLEVLNSFESKTVVDREILLKARIIRGRNLKLKILGDGELKKALTVKADSFSVTAKTKIEAAGGRAELV